MFYSQKIMTVMDADFEKYIKKCQVAGRPESTARLTLAGKQLSQLSIAPKAVASLWLA